MPAPTLDRDPESTHAGTSAGRRRRRRQFLLVAAALVVLAVAVGTSLAIATRPVATQVPAEAGAAPAGDQDADAGQGATGQSGQDVQTGTPTGPSGTGSPGTGTSAAALPDGDHDAYITSLDRAGNRIVVDVVQVCHDEQAVEAAIADGRSRSQARYLTTWVRNENPRLRTLPLASGLDVRLWGSCEEGGGREQQLATLAAHARQQGTFYYTLTVAGGKVQRIQERLAINAC